MSPRAAWRLERFRFGEGYDYQLGKYDWLAFDGPHEGAAEPAGDAAVRDLPTCAEDEPVAALTGRLRPDVYRGVVAVGPTGVLIAAVRRE
jgi:hypothetical protein